MVLLLCIYLLLFILIHRDSILLRGRIDAEKTIILLLTLYLFKTWSYILTLSCPEIQIKVFLYLLSVQFLGLVCFFEPILLVFFFIDIFHLLLGDFFTLY
jgi:hypothetical protein